MESQITESSVKFLLESLFPCASSYVTSGPENFFSFSHGLFSLRQESQTIFRSSQASLQSVGGILLAHNMRSASWVGREPCRVCATILPVFWALYTLQTRRRPPNMVDADGGKWTSCIASCVGGWSGIEAKAQMSRGGGSLIIVLITVEARTGLHVNV